MRCFDAVVYEDYDIKHLHQLQTVQFQDAEVLILVTQ